MGLKALISGKAIKVYINAKYLKGIGKMSSIDIDSVQKVIRCSFDLEGEKEPIDAEIAYSLDRTGTKGITLNIEHIKASRLWIEELFNNFVPKSKRIIPLLEPLATVVNATHVL